MSTLEEQAIKTAGKATESVLNKLLGPSAELLGNGIANYLKDKLANSPYWGEETKKAQEENVKDTMNVFLENFNKIDDKDKKQLSVNIVAPVIDSLFTYFEEPNYKEMFAKLIAASCDDRSNDKISPYFVEAIKQISHKEAIILADFKNKESNELPIANYKFILKNNGYRYYKKYIFIFDDSSAMNDYSEALINLQRLGFIIISFQRALLHDNEYQIYKNNEDFKSKKQEILENTKLPEYKFKDLEVEKGIIELTLLGSNFIDLCL